MNLLRNVVVAAVVAAGAVTASVTWADSRAKGSGFISVKASEIKWADAPSVGPGAKIAVLEGDLKAAAPFTMRLMLPPNLKIGVHTHPAVERVTVLSGTFYFAIGDKYEPAKAAAYELGDGFMVPIGMPMFGYTTKEASIIQIHGVGPWGIHYHDPADAAKKSK
jgi:uncharacterized RmlC-like cupin family protein